MSVGKDLKKKKKMDGPPYRVPKEGRSLPWWIPFDFKFSFLPPPSVRCERSNRQTCNYFPLVVRVVKIYLWQFLFFYFDAGSTDRPVCCPNYCVRPLAGLETTHCKSNWHERTVRGKTKNKKCFVWIFRDSVVGKMLFGVFFVISFFGHRIMIYSSMSFGCS